VTKVQLITLQQTRCSEGRELFLLLWPYCGAPAWWAVPARRNTQTFSSPLAKERCLGADQTDLLL